MAVDAHTRGTAGLTHRSEQGILGAAASLAVFVAGLGLAQHVV